MELVDTVRAGQVRKLDADRRMLMLLRVTAEFAQPVVVLAHLLGPDFHHRFGNGERAAQRGQVGDSRFDG